jgi:hypothetical protein
MRVFLLRRRRVLHRNSLNELATRARRGRNSLGQSGISSCCIHSLLAPIAAVSEREQQPDYNQTDRETRTLAHVHRVRRLGMQLDSGWGVDGRYRRCFLIRLILWVHG